MFVKELRASDNVPYSLCNILMRRLLRELKMVAMGNNYYTPARKVQFPQYSLELWPGCVTSVLPALGGTSLVCDISHKTVRLDSILTTIERFRTGYRTAGNWRAAAEADLCKATIITRYNNCSYRLERIDWDRTPMDKFEWEGHGRVTFAEYVLRIYNKKCINVSQPMLIASRKAR
jgi:aubergine-like protein